jgi:hypothetical protein
MSIIVHGNFWEDGSCTVYGRITARDGTGTSITGEGKALVQADLSSATYAIFDRSSTTPETPIATGTLTIGSVVFNTLQTSTDDPVWDVDTTGFNLRADFAASLFPSGGVLYRIEIKLTTTGSAVGWAVFEGLSNPVYTS